MDVLHVEWCRGYVYSYRKISDFAFKLNIWNSIAYNHSNVIWLATFCSVTRKYSVHLVINIVLFCSCIDAHAHRFYLNTQKRAGKAAQKKEMAPRLWMTKANTLAEKRNIAYILQLSPFTIPFFLPFTLWQTYSMHVSYPSMVGGWNWIQLTYLTNNTTGFLLSSTPCLTARNALNYLPSSHGRI